MIGWVEVIVTIVGPCTPVLTGVCVNVEVMAMIDVLGTIVEGGGMYVVDVGGTETTEVVGGGV